MRLGVQDRFQVRGPGFHPVISLGINISVGRSQRTTNLNARASQSL